MIFPLDAASERFATSDPDVPPEPKRARTKRPSYVTQTLAMVEQVNPAKVALSVIAVLVSIVAFAIGGPIFVLDRLDATRVSIEQKVGEVSKDVQNLSDEVQANRFTIQNQMDDRWRKSDMKAWAKIMEALNKESGFQVPPVE